MFAAAGTPQPLTTRSFTAVRVIKFWRVHMSEARGKRTN